jgi:hypothetical protein
MINNSIDNDANKWKEALLFYLIIKYLNTEIFKFIFYFYFFFLIN